MSRRRARGSVSQPQTVTPKQAAMCRLLGFTVAEHHSMRTHPKLPVHGTDNDGQDALFWMYPDGKLETGAHFLSPDNMEKYTRQLRMWDAKVGADA